MNKPSELPEITNIPNRQPNRDSNEAESAGQGSVCRIVIRYKDELGSGDMITSRYSQKGIIAERFVETNNKQLSDKKCTYEEESSDKPSTNGDFWRGDIIACRYSQKGTVVKTIIETNEDFDLGDKIPCRYSQMGITAMVISDIDIPYIPEMADIPVDMNIAVNQIDEDTPMDRNILDEMANYLPPLEDERVEYDTNNNEDNNNDNNEENNNGEPGELTNSQKLDLDVAKFIVEEHARSSRRTIFDRASSIEELKNIVSDEQTKSEKQTADETKQRKTSLELETQYHRIYDPLFTDKK